METTKFVRLRTEQCPVKDGQEMVPVRRDAIDESVKESLSLLSQIFTTPRGKVCLPAGMAAKIKQTRALRRRLR